MEKAGGKRVLIVDQQGPGRRALVDAIAGAGGLVVCAEVETADETLEFLAGRQVDLVVMDMGIEGVDGVHLTRRIQGLCPDVAIVAVSGEDEPACVKRAFRAGANGYVLRSEAPDAIAAAIGKVLAGGTYVSVRLATRIVETLASNRPDSVRNDKRTGLPETAS